jgi:hypothetical protein
MQYYRRHASPFSVEVVISEGDEHIESRKYRGEELVCHAAGPDFQKAMIHTTIVGLLDDEPTDERNWRHGACS